MCSYKSHACMRIGRISWTKWTPVNEQNKVAKQRKHVSAVLWMGVPWTFLGLSFRLFNTFRVFLYKLSRHHDLVIASTAANTKVYSNTQNFPFLASAWVRFFHQQDISRPDIHICHHPLSNHKYIILYPISFRMAISPENIFLSLYKYSKTEGGNPVKFHKCRFYFSIFSHLKHNCRAAPGHSPA